MAHPALTARSRVEYPSSSVNSTRLSTAEDLSPAFHLAPNERPVAPPVFFPLEKGVSNAIRSSLVLAHRLPGAALRVRGAGGGLRRVQMVDLRRLGLRLQISELHLLRQVTPRARLLRRLRQR